MVDPRAVSAHPGALPGAQAGALPGAHEVLSRFWGPTQDWFRGAFAAPTPAQVGAWSAIGEGDHTLVVAPTGSGKTLSAFLWALDRLARTPPPQELTQRCRVLYVSPLKALATDVERNLRAPLTGIRYAAQRLGERVPDVTVALRSGDTPAAARRDFVRRPPDVFITTPESLFLVLTSAAREVLAGVETVIVDEVHAVAGTKRGAHLALTLERLDALLPAPAQRIGLSATVRPVETVARFLAGTRSPGSQGGRRVTIVQPPSTKVVELRVVVPVPDMSQVGQPTGDLSGQAAGELPRASIWPAVEESIVDLVAAHRSTLVFANSRRLAERLTTRLNEIWAERTAEPEPGPEPAQDPGPAGATPLRPPAQVPAQVMAQAGASAGAPAVLARAHHGSVSREQRSLIEDDLKSGRLPAVVATSSLELGIDMGAVDLVVQVESPPSVASGLQRVGRAGHQVGAVSRGVVFPKFRGDLVQTAVVTERMRAGAIEELRVPASPLDVLAQQIVAMTALDDWSVDDLEQLVRRAAPFTSLTRGVLEAVLDMLAGRYPSEEFAELRPRIVWDRVTGTLSGRPGAQRLAVTSGGTIPDRGLYGVFLATGQGPGRRVGELDEEMVYESRVGDAFTLGTSTWRIEDITTDRVLVSPAPGQPGKLPFWHGEALGRPAELGRALGAFVREVVALPDDAARERVGSAGLDTWATDNLLGYLGEQRESTGSVPDDRTVVVESFRDELGDWRVVVHSPFGAQVHAPWALVVAARLRERFGLDAQVMSADDGLVLRLPDVGPGPGDAYGDGDGEYGTASTPLETLPDTLLETLVVDPEDVEALVTAEVGGSALFASRFRECAARALLLPRRRPDRRTPLWQQRQRAAQLLEVASRYPSFPIVLETVREVLQDVFDVPALADLMRSLRSGAVRVVQVSTTTPSPFARGLLFGYVAQFLYEGDTPLAERRAAALSLDPTLLAELLGRGDGASLADLLDADALTRTRAELQRLADGRRCRDAEDVTDLLRSLGPLTTAEIARRSVADPAEVTLWVSDLEHARRLIAVRIAGQDRWAVTEDAGRLRDALGVPLPVGIPEAFLAPVSDPVADLVARWARTHVPFTAATVAARLGLGVAVVADALHRLARTGRVTSGDLLPPHLLADLDRVDDADDEPGVAEGAGAGAPATVPDVPDVPDVHSVPAVPPAVHWCDAEVLRLLRRRSLAALRSEVEPVPARDLARFLPAWQQVGSRLRGADGVLRVVEQLAGARVPASALEPLVLAGRVERYSPALLDELTAAGEVLWQGAGALPGDDGWITLHAAEVADLTLRPPATGGEAPELADLHRRVLDALAGGGAYFFRPLADAVGSTDDAQLLDALWDLVWAGHLTNDTLNPLRAVLSGGRTSHRTPRAAPRARYARPGRLPRLGRPPALPARSGPPAGGGRWSRLPVGDAAPAVEPTVRSTALAEVLLDRHGVLTRGSVAAEDVPGGFAAVYRVLAAMEEAGRVRRGYFVEGLGASQFASTGAVDRLRAAARSSPLLPDETPRRPERPGSGRPPGVRAAGEQPAPALVLASTDPANPFGAALAWPERESSTLGDGRGHRPGRKAGAVVVVADGELVLYVERGGRTLLSFTDAPGALQAGADALALAVREGALGRLSVQRADGEHVLSAENSPLAAALEAAGFSATPRGLRVRA